MERDIVDRAEELLAFWFGPPDADPAERICFWFTGSPETDRALRETFAADHQRACAGELDGWAATPRGRLALLLLLDQLSRNLHRGQPAAFAQDAKALALALQGIEAGMDRQLRPLERLFFYMPLEHAEDLAVQEKSIRCFEALVGDASAAGESAEPYTVFVDYAVRHRDIVRRFGRFPHRNAILGRPSTPEEVEFLKQPGSSF